MSDNRNLGWLDQVEFNIQGYIPLANLSLLVSVDVCRDEFASGEW